MATTHGGRAIARVRSSSSGTSWTRGPDLDRVLQRHAHALVKISDTDGRAGWGETYLVPGLPEICARWVSHWWAVPRPHSSPRPRYPLVAGASVCRLRAGDRAGGPAGPPAGRVHRRDLRRKQADKVRAYAASGGYVEGRDPADTWPEEVARVRGGASPP